MRRVQREGRHVETNLRPMHWNLQWIVFIGGRGAATSIERVGIVIPRPRVRRHSRSAEVGRGCCLFESAAMRHQCLGIYNGSRFPENANTPVPQAKVANFEHAPSPHHTRSTISRDRTRQEPEVAKSEAESPGRPQILQCNFTTVLETTFTSTSSHHAIQTTSTEIPFGLLSRNNNLSKANVGLGDQLMVARSSARASTFARKRDQKQIRGIWGSDTVSVRLRHYFRVDRWREIRETTKHTICKVPLCVKLPGSFSLQAE